MGTIATQDGRVVIRDSIVVRAPIERCFALSTRLEIVHRELRFKGEPGTGHVHRSSRVRWSGWMFGLHHEHVSVIPRFDPPYYFRDQMERGRSRYFHHDHWLRATPEGTVMEDEIHFAVPWYWGGGPVARWVLGPRVAHLLQRRFHLLKSIAEGDDWQRYVDADALAVASEECG